MELLTPERVTIISLLLIALGAGARRMWVWGYQLTDSEKRETLANARAERWEGIALRALKVSEKVVTVNGNGRQ